VSDSTKQEQAWKGPKESRVFNYWEGVEEVLMTDVRGVLQGLTRFAELSGFEELFDADTDESDLDQEWEACKKLFELLRYSQSQAIPALRATLDNAGRAEGVGLLMQRGGVDVSKRVLKKQCNGYTVYRDCPAINQAKEWNSWNLRQFVEECLAVFEEVDWRAYQQWVQSADEDEPLQWDMDQDLGAVEAQFVAKYDTEYARHLQKFSAMGWFTPEDLLHIYREVRAMYEFAKGLADLSEDEQIKKLAEKLEVYSIRGCESKYFALPQSWQGKTTKELQQYFPGKLRGPQFYSQLVSNMIVLGVALNNADFSETPTPNIGSGNVWHAILGVQPGEELAERCANDLQYASGVLDRAALVECYDGWSPTDQNTLRLGLAMLVFDRDPQVAMSIIQSKARKYKSRIVECVQEEWESYQERDASSLMPGGAPDIIGFVSYLSTKMQDPIDLVVGGLLGCDRSDIAKWIDRYNEDRSREMHVNRDGSRMDSKSIISTVREEVVALVREVNVRTGRTQKLSDTQEIAKVLRQALYKGLYDDEGSGSESSGDSDESESLLKMTARLHRRFGVPLSLLVGTPAAEKELKIVLQGLDVTASADDTSAALSALHDVGRIPAERLARSPTPKQRAWSVGGKLGILAACGLAWVLRNVFVGTDDSVVPLIPPEMPSSTSTTSTTSATKTETSTTETETSTTKTETSTTKTETFTTSTTSATKTETSTTKTETSTTTKTSTTPTTTSTTTLSLAQRCIASLGEPNIFERSGGAFYQTNCHWMVWNFTLDEQRQVLRTLGDGTMRELATPEEIALWRDVFDGANAKTEDFMVPESLMINPSAKQRSPLELRWAGDCPSSTALRFGEPVELYQVRILAAYLSRFGEVFSYDLLSKEIDGSTSGRALYRIAANQCEFSTCLQSMSSKGSGCSFSLPEGRNVDQARMLRVALALASRHMILDTIFRFTRMMHSSLSSTTLPQPDVSERSTAFDRMSKSRRALGALLAHTVSVDSGVLQMLNANPVGRAKQMLYLARYYDPGLRDALTLIFGADDQYKVRYPKGTKVGLLSSHLSSGIAIFKGNNQVGS
jgi:hypothetical protein